MSIVGLPEGWREWLLRDRTARRLADVLAVADTAGIAVAVTLIAATVIHGRPAGGIGGLLAPGIVLLAAGQLWAILVTMARKPPGSSRRSRAGYAMSVGDSLRAMFGSVDRRVTWTVTALCVIGWLSFMTTAFFFAGYGNPAGPGRGCTYRMDDHGVYTCVSRSYYDLAGAAEQRLAAGIFLFFFAVHLYAALASHGQSADKPLV